MKTVLGLTGGSGGGKSRAASFFEEKGALVIDADKIAREIMNTSHPALHEVADAFPGVLLPEGGLNRKALAKIVFSDSNALEKLNRITHAYIICQIEETVAQTMKAFVVIDAPLLFESGLDRLCSACLFVTAERKTRIRRIMKRDGLTEEEACARIDAQHEDDYFRSQSDFIVENNGDETSLLHQLDSVLKELDIETP